MRTVLDAELPGGSAWKIKEDGGADLWFDGIADNWQDVKDDLAEAADFRNAARTPILDDLEREYGIEKNTALTEAERRERLLAVQTEGPNTGTAEYVQARLRAAGFTDIYVYQNDPAVDPANFIGGGYLMVCGATEAVCGATEAVCGSILDDLIINGNLFYTDSDIPLPVDSGYWSLIFFIGGVATRDPITDAITAITRYTVPFERRDEFRRLVVKYKPLHSWAAAVVAYS